jgi:hypothetical protein
LIGEGTIVEQIDAGRGIFTNNDLRRIFDALEAARPDLADALLLADLEKTPSDKAITARLDRYQVLVDCRDAKDQKQLNKELQRKGYATRKVTSVGSPGDAPPAGDISPDITAG